MSSSGFESLGELSVQNIPAADGSALCFARRGEWDALLSPVLQSSVGQALRARLDLEVSAETTLDVFYQSKDAAQIPRFPRESVLLVPGRSQPVIALEPPPGPYRLVLRPRERQTDPAAGR